MDDNCNCKHDPKDATKPADEPQNPTQWPGDKLIKPPAKIDGDEPGESTTVPVIR